MSKERNVVWPGHPAMAAGKLALRKISLAIPSGQICGLLGPNGAGKTTLFRVLMGVLKAIKGILLMNGRDAFADRVKVMQLIGFLPDEPVFYSYLSGRETLEFERGHARSGCSRDHAAHGADNREAAAGR